MLSPPTIITITDSSSRLDGSAGALTGGVVVEVTLARPRLAACHPAPLPIPASKRSASSTWLVTRIHRWPFSRMEACCLFECWKCILQTIIHPSIHPSWFILHQVRYILQVRLYCRATQRDKPVAGKNEHLQSIQFAETCRSLNTTHLTEKKPHGNQTGKPSTARETASTSEPLWCPKRLSLKNINVSHRKPQASCR